jgi:2',3'-cyclic-nucleotide 2'-phosphodiesterase (5'-nucleotidase family)
LIFDPAIETAKRWVPFLNRHADVVVVLSHLGWCPLGDCISPNDVHLAQQVPGIDLILGGHSGGGGGGGGHSGGGGGHSI